MDKQGNVVVLAIELHPFRFESVRDSREQATQILQYLFGKDLSPGIL
jgi:hypothetical protein